MRELNAVDSEHKKNHQSDVWRIFQVNKHLSKEYHPWRKFGSGNKESLEKVGKDLKAKGLLNGDGAMKGADGSLAPTPAESRAPSPASSVRSVPSESEGDGGVVGRETRRRLVEWWSKEYCAGRMRLCVVGKGECDFLQICMLPAHMILQNRWMNFRRWLPASFHRYPTVAESHYT